MATQLATATDQLWDRWPTIGILAGKLSAAHRPNNRLRFSTSGMQSTLSRHNKFCS
jgi:hypothetical protein